MSITSWRQACLGLDELTAELPAKRAVENIKSDRPNTTPAGLLALWSRYCIDIYAIVFASSLAYFVRFIGSCLLKDS